MITFKEMLAESEGFKFSQNQHGMELYQIDGVKTLVGFTVSGTKVSGVKIKATDTSIGRNAASFAAALNDVVMNRSLGHSWDHVDHITLSNNGPMKKVIEIIKKKYTNGKGTSSSFTGSTHALTFYPNKTESE